MVYINGINVYIFTNVEILSYNYHIKKSIKPFYMFPLSEKYTNPSLHRKTSRSLYSKY